MVDPLSSNMASPLVGQPNAAVTPVRAEPAVQITHMEGGRNGGNAAAQQGGTEARSDTAPTPKAVFEELNATMEAWDTGMRFEIDEDTQQLVVSVIDTKSGDVLRQIPSEEVLHVAKMIAQFQGKFINVKA